MLLHNSDAGDEDHSAEAITSLVVNAGHEVAYHSLDGPDWPQALIEAADLVAIAGGDGTVRQVLTAMADREQALVTVLPLGSANNIANAFALGDRCAAELIAGWSNAVRRRFRLGALRAPDRSDVFVETVGGGLFAEAIRQAEGIEQDGDDKVELGLRVVRRLIDEMPLQPWRLVLDGVEHHGDYLAVEAMVIGETGPRVPLAPAARPEDPLVDVVLVGEEDRQQLRGYLDARLADQPQPLLRLEVHRCSKAEVEPLAAASMRVDDELWDVSSWTATGSRAHVSVAPVVIEILVSS